MVRRIVWIALFAVLVAVGSRMVEYSETVKVEIVRVAGLGLLALAIARGRELRERLRSPLDVAVVAWLGVELVATLFSIAPSLSVFGEQEQHEGLLTSLALAGAYFAARLELRDAASARRTLDVLFAGAAVASTWAFLQAAGVIAMSPEGAQLGGVLRPFGTLGHPNLLGVVTAAAAAAAFARALTDERRRVLPLVLAFVFAAATAITFSRGAWLALVAGAACVGVLATRVRRGRPLPRGVWIGALAAVVALVAVAAFSSFGRLFAARLRELLSPAGGSGRSRLEIWRAALAAWRVRPLLGHGPDTFGLTSQQFQTPDYWRFAWGEITFHAHSIVLQSLATRGVLGLAAGVVLVIALGAALRRAFAIGGAAAAGALALAGAFAALLVAGLFGALGICGALLAALLGAHAASLAGAPVAPQRERAAAAKRARVRFAFTRAGGVAAGVALATAAFAANELAGSRAIAGSLIALRESMAAPRDEADALRASAIDLASRASAQLAWDDHAPRILATALMQEADATADPAPLVRAEAAARLAIERVPQRAADHQCLADVLVQRGRIGAAIDAVAPESSYRAASQRWPASPLILAGWARARMETGRARDALEPARRLVELYPASGLAQLVLAEASLAAGDTLAARAAIGASATADWHGDVASLDRAERLSHIIAAAGH